MDISAEKVGRKVEDLLEVLRRYHSREAKDAAEHLYSLIHTSHYRTPMGFCSAGSPTWRRLQQDSQLRQVTREVEYRSRS
jgi:hypothetical protein